MKTLLLTVVALIIFASQSIAQNSMAYIDGSKKGVETETSITIEFRIDNITDEISMKDYATKFSQAEGVHKVVNYELSNNIATFKVALNKTKFLYNCQGMFESSGIKLIKIEGVDGYDVIKTEEIVAIGKKMNEERKSVR
jgi:hypothetical protein